MLTAADIKKLLKDFATKDELHLEINRVREEMVTKNEFSNLVDGVYTKLDKVLGEVKDIRQEQRMHQGQHDRISNRVDNVETRVDILEQAA